MQISVKNLNFTNFAFFQVNFVVFRPDFDENLSEFQEIAAKYCKMLIFQTKTVLMNTSIPERKNIEVIFRINIPPADTI